MIVDLSFYDVLLTVPLLPLPARLENQSATIDSRLQNTTLNLSLCKFILLSSLPRPLIHHQHNGEDIHDRMTFHVAIVKASWTVTEDGLKMMCLFGKKGGLEAGSASRHCQRGTKHLDLAFFLSNYLPAGVFIFKR